MTSPGGGFQQGEDFVALRLSMDIPDNAATGLRTLIQEVDRLKTSTEAAGRSEDQFVRYLESLATAADRSAAAVRNLQDAQKLGQPTGGGLWVPGGQLNAPPQYVNPFAGTTAGMGMGRMPATIPEAQDMMDQLRGVNPRAYINKMAASGWIRTGDVPASAPSDEDLAHAAQRIGNREMAVQGQLGGRGIAAQVLSEYGGGGAAGVGDLLRRMGGVAPSTQQAVGPAEQGAQRAAERTSGGVGGFGGILEMMGLGGLAKTVGPVGMGLGAAAGTFELSQRIGQAIQGERAMGAIRGGGAEQGFGYELQIRQMALNPFISTEQARQVIQGALREGYTGREFDTVTQFVVQNLKDMNVSISTSFDLLRKNVDEGGESISGLNANLKELQDMSKAGATSLPDLIKNFANLSAAGVAAGMPGAQAAQMGLGAGATNNIQGLQGTAAQLAQTFLQPQNLPFLEYQGGLQVPQGTLPEAIPMMTSGQDMLQAASNVIKTWALQFYNSAGRPADGTTKYFNAMVLWRRRLAAAGVPWANNMDQVKAYFHQYTIEGIDPFTQGIQRSQQEQQQMDYRSGQSATPPMQMLFGTFAGGPGQLPDIAKVGGALGQAVLGMGSWGNVWNAIKGIGQPSAEQRIATQSGWHNPMLDSIQAQYADQGGIVVLDESGKPIKFDANNKDEVQKLLNQQYKWRPANQPTGPGYTISQGPTPESAGAVGGTTNVQGQVTIGLTPEARQLITAPQMARLTPHEQASNQGWTDMNGNVAATNNAPPGYTLPRQWGSGAW